MRVLITNRELAYRAGTELYVRDLANGLRDRGHHPVLYSRTLGDFSRELRSATIPVTDDLGTIAAPPDIIHGHHHIETMSALMHFQGVPAVYFCHGWIPWDERPPRFPRILRYAAVSELCGERLVVEHGVPGERVALILNSCDAADASAVSRQIRAMASRESVLDQLLALYEQVRREHSAAMPDDTQAEGRAAAAYLASLTPDISRHDPATAQMLLLRRLAAAPLSRRLLRLPGLRRLTALAARG